MASVLRVILAVYEATSGVALASVADLKAAPEVAQMKSIKCEVEPASTKAFPLMYLLEGKDPRNVIAMTYSDGASRFCRPF